MEPTDIETILKFYMENLPEDKLAELDGRLTGEADSGAAMDSALAKRKTWAAMDSAQRQAVRKSRQDAYRQSDADRARRSQMFPHMDRIG